MGGGTGQQLDLKRYFLGRYVRVALPSQIWAVIIFAITLGSYLVNTLMVLFNIQGLSWIIQNSNIPNGGPYMSHSWFVTVILLCYVLVPLLNRHAHRMNWKHFALFCLAGVILELFDLNVSYFLMFSLSYFVAAKKYDATRINIIWIVVVLIASIGIRLAGHMYLDDTKLYNNYITAFTQDIIAASILVLISKAIIRFGFVTAITEWRCSKFIEKHSFAIYLVHYALIPILYERLPIAFASIAFFSSTIILSVGLDFLTGRASKFMFPRL